MKNNTVLIVDDSILICEMVKSIFKPKKSDNSVIDIITADNGDDALSICKKYKPDIVLLDIVLPSKSGYEVCNELKSDRETRDIPVIFLTSKAHNDDIIKGFECGAVDYVQKPFGPLELKSRVMTHLEIKNTRDKLIKTNEKLAEALEKINKLAISDPLTNLYNRRYMQTRFIEEVKRFSRGGEAFSIIMGDVDFFKKINDSYGHDVGDMMLKSVAKSMIDSCRTTDIICRWGGEEFLILAAQTDEDAARLLAEKIRKNIEHIEIKHDKISVKATITLGIAQFDAGKTIEQNISIADKSLYYGKSTGRNKVVCAGDIKDEVLL